MGRRVECPLPVYAEAFVILPDEWLGEHAERRDEAVRKGQELGPTLRQFAVSVALLETWGNIPGLDGNPEQWDFEKLPLDLIAWISASVTLDFNQCFVVPKVSSSPSPNGQEVLEPTLVSIGEAKETT